MSFVGKPPNSGGAGGGSVGPTGPAGPAGPTGPLGSSGATGPAGAAGAMGPSGATGAQGPTGAGGLPVRETLVINGGSITLAGGATTLVRVSGEGGVDDDLIAIYNPTDGQVLVLMLATGGHRITVRQDTSAGGNILIPTGQAIGDNPWDTLMLVYNDDMRGWFRVGGSDYTP